MRSEIIRYVDSIMGQHHAILQGDDRLSDQCHDQAVLSLCRIKQYDHWEREFSKLLRHENRSVRVHSATQLLPYRPMIAQMVLFIASMSAGVAGFEAGMVLKQWRRKELKLPEFVGDEIVYR